MTKYSTDQLISAWDPVETAPAQRRIGALLAVIEGAASAETLGERNRRLLRLHRALVDAPLEAHIKCASCGVDNEFTVPTDSILGAPPANPESHVSIRSRGRSLTFRLPLMGDIEATSGASTSAEVRRAVLERCRIAGDLGALTDDAAEQLGREFEARDPAATVVINISCASCRTTIAASIDLASFVVADLDRVIESLYRDIDLIATAYGWDEPTILALPASRRRRYVDMIASRPPRSKAPRAQ